jgi:hypothetical protein
LGQFFMYNECKIGLDGGFSHIYESKILYKWITLSYAVSLRQWNWSLLIDLTLRKVPHEAHTYQYLNKLTLSCQFFIHVVHVSLQRKLFSYMLQKFLFHLAVCSFTSKVSIFVITVFSQMLVPLFLRLNTFHQIGESHYPLSLGETR